MITEAQKQNLIRVCNYLLAGQLEADFTMSYFTSHSRGGSKLDCGTSGCFVGHGPYAGVEKLENETWVEYGQKSFGITISSAEWAYLFSSYWCQIDNTAQGAAIRVLHFLTHGLPTDWCEQIHGAARISYL